MKTLFRNNYLELSAFKGLLLGVAYDDGMIIIMMGIFALQIKTWAFNRKPKSSGIEI